METLVGICRVGMLGRAVASQSDAWNAAYLGGLDADVTRSMRVALSALRGDLKAAEAAWGMTLNSFTIERVARERLIFA